MSASKIIGHSSQIEALNRDVETENIAHAYLFSGAAHLGKMTIAKWFAEKILCESSDDESTCRSQFEKLTHPDLLVLDQLWIEGECDDWDIVSKSSNTPQVHRSKAKAKTNTIGIDDIRALQERLHETGYGEHRCCIIRSIERMADPAANAFLKILEEPPPGLVFLLTTEHRTSLLPTIVSRARVLKFTRVPLNDMHDVLSGSDDGSFVAHLAQGAPGVALTLLEDPDLLREERILHTKAKSFWETKKLREKIQILDPLLERGAPSSQMLLHLGLTLRERGDPEDALRVQKLSALAKNLQTNAHRGLLVQQFAMSV